MWTKVYGNQHIRLKVEMIRATFVPAAQEVGGLMGSLENDFWALAYPSDCVNACETFVKQAC